MVFGGFGLGRLGFTHPMRTEAPESETVSLLPDQQQWMSDWEKRRAAEAARARPAAAPRAQTFDNAGYLAANPDVADPSSWGGAFPANPVGAYHYGAHGAGEGRQGTNFDEAKYLQLNPDVAAAVSGGQFSSGLDHFAKHGFGENRAVNVTPGSAGYTPNFSALNAEWDKMTPMFENQTRQQQAYDWMQGGNQENGLMSEDYANAGFNTITGMSNPYAGPGQIEGVDMDWAQGVYDPQTQRGTGTYTPTHQRTNFGW
ncbi:hypothetical protein [Aquamicrobium zhengzhouense]|uniref:Uncharacterized protein n=1 Tax=Aquamicrobium zhengzhouense TaxID=2781738 RepID=A0ABS0SD56_9HYPH|nr:hypothetical protein [Aquamicrobium zhengzhouense]MBI1620363.1 hypothetical protein [Aquamicrobium zhengzhouense]